MFWIKDLSEVLVTSSTSGFQNELISLNSNLLIIKSRNNNFNNLFEVNITNFGEFCDFKYGCYWESMGVNNLRNKDRIVVATLRAVENILSIQKEGNCLPNILWKSSSLNYALENHFLLFNGLHVLSSKVKISIYQIDTHRRRLI